MGLMKREVGAYPSFSLLFILSKQVIKDFTDTIIYGLLI